MGKPVTISNVFQNQPGPIPLAELDENFGDVAGAINDAASYTNYGPDTGVANAYIVNLAAGITFALASGVAVLFKAANGNTGTSTLNVNSTGVTAFVRRDGTALQNGDVLAGQMCFAIYDGTNWQFAGSSVTGGVTLVPVRQTVLVGSADSSNVPNHIQDDTGGGVARVKLVAASSPCVVAFAAGFATGGAQDYVSRLTADAANIVGTIAPNSTAYIYSTYSSPTAVTWAQTPVQPHSAPGYDRTRQALLHLNGTNGATSTTDDYGSAWTMTGATLSTTAPKFGSASLSFPFSGGQLFNTTQWTTLGPDAWVWDFWVNLVAVPTAIDPYEMFIHAHNAAGMGVELRLEYNAGNPKLALYASSNGTSANLIGGAQGTKVWTNGTDAGVWRHIAVQFDPVTPRYWVYVDGVADLNGDTSGGRICALTAVRFGSRSDAGSLLNGKLDEIRFGRALRWGGGITFTPPAAEGTLQGHWFDTTRWTMKNPTTASAAANTDPTFTAVNVVYHAECDVNNTPAVAALRNYAYAGRYYSAEQAVASATARTVQHNIGQARNKLTAYLRCKTSEAGYVVGDELPFPLTRSSAGGNPQGPFSSVARMSATMTPGSDAAPLVAMDKATGAHVVLTNANWVMVMDVERGF